MSLRADAAHPVARWDLPILGVLAVLTFAVIPIGLTTIYGGLPAHPLFAETMLGPRRLIVSSHPSGR